MESGKREQLFSVKSLFDLNRFCYVVVVCTLLRLEVLTTSLRIEFSKDINSIVAILAFSIIIGLGME